LVEDAEHLGVDFTGRQAIDRELKPARSLWRVSKDPAFGIDGVREPSPDPKTRIFSHSLYVAVEVNKILPETPARGGHGADLDRKATTQARSCFTGYPSSSPQIALTRDGEVVFTLERRDIEGRMAEEIAVHLTSAFDRLWTGGGAGATS
jgi:hypothetical protein